MAVTTGVKVGRILMESWNAALVPNALVAVRFVMKVPLVFGVPVIAAVDEPAMPVGVTTRLKPGGKEPGGETAKPENTGLLAVME